MPEIETSQSAKSVSYADQPDEASQLSAILIDIRSRRKPQDELCLIYHAAYRGRHMRAFFQSEVFRHYIAAARPAIERFTTRAAQRLIPSADCCEVFPGEGNPEDTQAESVRAYMQYVWTKKIHAYPYVRQLLRTYALYGRCISKTGVRVIDQAVATRNGVKMVSQVWPMARAVDPFMWYCFPETVTDAEDAQIMFEDVMMPFDLYDSMAVKPNMGVKKIAKTELTVPEWPTSHTRRLQFQNMADPTAVAKPKHPDDDPGKVDQNVEYVALTEVWRKKNGHWTMKWICWNLRGGKPEIVRDNPRPFPRSPYRLASGRDLPGEHYGTGIMDDLEPQQVLLNDQVNMTLEGQAVLFSPPAVINPDLVSRPQSLVFRPRAKWLMDPAGVKWLEPTDTTRTGFNGIQFTMSLMDSFSAAGNPLVEGQPLRNMPRAGFSVSTLINLAMADLKDAAQMIEDLILTPTLADIYYLAVEFIPEDQIIKIPGARGFPKNGVTIEDLVGDWSFQWVGSLQAQDFQVRAQRLIAFIGQMAKLAPVIMQDLQMQKKTVNWSYLLNRTFREGLGERGVTQFVRDMTPEEQQALMAQQQFQQQLQVAQLIQKTRSARGPGSGGKSGGPGTPGPNDKAPGSGEESQSKISGQMSMGGQNG